ncbi:MAG: adenylyltransferase/cytidyltransferase family protein [Candidatus Shapirobacteria bacterium]
MKKKTLEIKKTIVLVGGCFDILHSGHISFLENAKKEGDLLFLLLESDQNIKKKKGSSRPINNQKNRTKALLDLKIIDRIILLPEMGGDEDYDLLIKEIKPNVIAITTGDEAFDKKSKQAKSVGAKLVEVINLIPNQSTTRILKSSRV